MSRCLITTPTTWYVDATNGSDSNDGTAASCAFQTIQHGIDTLRHQYDFAAIPTLKILPRTGADVRYRESVNLDRWVGTAPYFRILGDSSAAVCVAPFSGNAFTAVGAQRGASGCPWLIENIMVEASTGCYGVLADAGSVVLLQNPNFSYCGAAHMGCVHGGFMEVLAGPVTISGGAQAHVQCAAPTSEFIYQSNSITFINNPSFSVAFLIVGLWGYAYLANLNSWSGAHSCATSVANDTSGRFTGPANGQWP